MVQTPVISPAPFSGQATASEIPEFVDEIRD
jgi:hypothetical protein